MTEFVSGKAALDDPQRLKGPAEPLVERDPESAEFLRRRAHSDRQVHPAVRDVVEDGDIFGHPHRVVQRQEQHIRADANPRGARRHRGQKGDRSGVPRIRREVVFARPDIVEAEFLGECRFFEVVAIEVRQGLRPARQPANSHRDDQLHACLLPAPITLALREPSLSPLVQREGAAPATFL